MTATSYETTETVTVAEAIAFSTTTTTIANIFKRQNNPTRTTNPLPSITSVADKDAGIASSVYSACSCLRLSPSTVSAQLTVQAVCLFQTIHSRDHMLIWTFQTRTISGIDFQSTTTSTVTEGTTTVEFTIAVFPTKGPIVRNDTSSYPTGTSLPYPSSKFSVLPLPLSNTTSLPSGLQVSMGSSPIPSSNIIVTSAVFVTGSSLSTSTNATKTSAGVSSSTVVTAASQSFLSVIIPSFTSSLLPLATSISVDGCPDIDGTNFITPDNETYLVECYRSFPGDSYLGLQESTLADCLNVCDAVNLGFSEVNCYGVTFTPYNTSAGAVTCNLKNEDSVKGKRGDLDEYAVSAVLLIGV